MDVKKTQEAIDILEKKYSEAQIIAADIFNKLITKTSILERLKATLGETFDKLFNYCIVNNLALESTNHI